MRSCISLRNGSIKGELKSAPEVKYRGILDYDTPIEWVNTEGMNCNEEFVGESFGRINKAEAALPFQLTITLIK